MHSGEEVATPSLEDLLAHVAQSDRGALQQLFKLEAARLVGIARRLVRSQAVAEDLVQEVFITVWQRAVTFDPARGSARTWIITILRHAAYRHLHRNGREVPFAEDDANVVAKANDPDVDVMRVDDKEALRRCLEALDPPKRTTLLLAYLEGLSHVQIAERLTVPLGTVKSWARRGLQSLRECLT